jgi:predicted ArsR family transcriptional regulator
MMRDQIMQMVRENPRTVKDLADAFGLSKQDILGHLHVLPVQAVRTVSHGGRGRPVVIIQYIEKS